MTISYRRYSGTCHSAAHAPQQRCNDRQLVANDTFQPGTESLLLDEDDSKCARNEYLDKLNF